MNLTKYALITALIGIFLLVFLAEKIEPQEIKIEEINDRMLDEYVKINAEVVKIVEKDSLTLLTLKDETASITAVIYQLINITGKVEVIGKVIEYNGKLEIQIEKIKNA